MHLSVWVIPVTALAVLAFLALEAVVAFHAGRWTKGFEDAPTMRRARAEGQRLHAQLPHDGPFDTEMRTGVQRRA